MLAVVVKHVFIPKQYWHWVPNWNAVGLAFVAPQIPFSIAMAVGSVFNYVWHKRSPVGFDMYMFSVAAGMLAGEGLGGVLQALLAVAKVDGSRELLSCDWLFSSGVLLTTVWLLPRYSIRHCDRLSGSRVLWMRDVTLVSFEICCRRAVVNVW